MNQKVCLLPFFTRNFFNRSLQSSAVVQHNPVSSSALDRLDLIPIQPNITRHVIRLDEQQAVFQSLYFPGEMVAVVHDDYVLSLGVRGRTQTRPKKSEQKNVARAANPNKRNVHFVTPRPKRDRRNIR